ncbi:ArdC family protein [Bradyrhizobium ivorense]|uniref:ArdC family protein n=1 Tax=Bradyrhizobium ivorense TaxID=2511166 RepID=UPI0027E29434|nr:ArdC-like ssDNA-binding domain-containing protein [Bradyrhizobium ivorense]
MARPWSASGESEPFALPRNAATGKSYSGINVLILWSRLAECGYASQRWLTFHQAQGLGASVRKGEHGTTVCYADRFIPKRKQEGGSFPAATDTQSEPAAIPFLRRYIVFNIDQCKGLPCDMVAPPPAVPEREIVPQAEALAAATLATIRIQGAEALYDPDADYVQVPPQGAFFDRINYYRTLCHELGHWTGHKNRRDRDQSGAFGSRDYANEELVALS